MVINKVALHENDRNWLTLDELLKNKTDDGFDSRCSACINGT